MKSMSLSEMELLLGTDERDKVPRSPLHQETEIDAENQNHPISGLTPDVVKDSASLELSKSSVVELDSELLHGGHTSKLQFLTPTKEVSARFGEDLVGSRLGTDTTKDSESPGQAESFANREEIISKPKVELNFNATAKESTKTTLRGYQNELAEPGIKGASYIICAPTGSGKTITVASICYKRMLKMKQEGHEEYFKAIFIVPTRHLKKQQREAFQELFVPGTVAALMPGEQFSSVFNRGNVRVLMITAQVLVNALIQGQFRLSDASMIVFDECHHTTLNHPYNEIMRQYLKDKKVLHAEKIAAGKWQVGQPQKGLPQVIGLTASVGTGTSDDAHSHIVTLCANLDCLGVKVVEKPENIEELKEKNKPPEADQIVATPKKDETDISRRFVQLLKETMEDIEKHLLSKYLSMDIGNDQTSPKGTQDYECWIATIRSEAEGHNEDLYACAAYLFHLNLALMVYEDLRATDAVQAVETFKLSTRSSIDVTTTGRNCRLIYEKNLPELRELAERDDPLGNPKLLCLQELIKRVFQKEPKSKAIVLARTRFATLALLEFIKESQDLQEIVRPVRIVGQSKEVDAGQTEAKQEAALDRFRDDNEDHPDRANLLVATDIVQEGLNIPACNAIIRYNFVSNEIGTVQSKGRARADKSMCFLIVESGSLNQRREYKNRERIIKMDEAIKQANEMDPKEWRRQLALRQLTIIQHVEEKEAKTQAHKSTHNASNVKVLCNRADCRAFVCHAKDIERRLSNYTCLDGTISERTRIRRFNIPREFRESRTVGSVHCGECGNQLGQAIEFLRGGVYKPGHNLLLKSLLFQYQLEDGSLEEKTFNKWKKVDFEIASEQ
ncbi:ATP-dependent RNA helicase DHX58-like [Diadema setosum]|uniref:ATP-dependent RNA helicase DHX58-like n=1 Tax=Diadema setosum TaxID=31175 RepID=UPI003B3A3DE8